MVDSALRYIQKLHHSIPMFLGNVVMAGLHACFCKQNGICPKNRSCLQFCLSVSVSLLHTCTHTYGGGGAGEKERNLPITPS